MVLDHLHVHQLGSRRVGHRDPVAGADERVGRRAPDLAVAARGEDHGLRVEELHRPVADVAEHRPRALAGGAERERGGEVLLVARDQRRALHELLVEHVHDRLPGDVGDVVGPRMRGAAEGAGPQPPVLAAVEGDAEVLEVEHLLRRLTAHDLDRVLVAQVVGALDGVEGVRLPGVTGIERRVDPALRCVRVRAYGMDLRDDPDGHTGLGGGERGPLAGEPGADDEDIMGRHRRYPVRPQACENRAREGSRAQPLLVAGASPMTPPDEAFAAAWGRTG